MFFVLLASMRIFTNAQDHCVYQPLPFDEDIEDHVVTLFALYSDAGSPRHSHKILALVNNRPSTSDLTNHIFTHRIFKIVGSQASIRNLFTFV